MRIRSADEKAAGIISVHATGRIFLLHEIEFSSPQMLFICSQLFRKTPMLSRKATFLYETVETRYVIVNFARTE